MRTDRHRKDDTQISGSFRADEISQGSGRELHNHRIVATITVPAVLAITVPAGNWYYVYTPVSDKPEECHL